MEPLKISEIVKSVNGTLVNCSDDITVKGASASIMNIKKQSLYIPLVKDEELLDPLMKKAYKRGAAAVMVTKKMKKSIPQIIIKDSKDAYGKLARYYRGKFNIPVIAVTGSYGKTSTKDLIAKVLDERFNVHKTKRNFNGITGVPSTILQLDRTHEISVIETGMETYGHIRNAVDIAKPSIGIITNIGNAHIGNFGKRKYIMKAKMEITSFFDKDSMLIINGDDEYLTSLEEKPYKIIKVSARGNGNYNATDIINLGEEGVRFKCTYKGCDHLFRTNVPGLHNIYNALFAIAIGELFDLDAGEVKNGILKYKNENLRMNIKALKNNAKIILDCYTAEPDTIRAAIDVLESFKAKRRIAVLGGMFGLGSQTGEAHRQIGKYIIGKCDELVTVGKNSSYIYGLAKDFIQSRHFQSKNEVTEYLKQIIQPGDVILINGGRMAEMETILTGLSNFTDKY